MVNKAFEELENRAFRALEDAGISESEANKRIRNEQARQCGDKPRELEAMSPQERAGYESMIEAHNQRVMATQTQRGILEALEPMAQTLAEMGLASSKAMGDRPEAAIRKWSMMLTQRAIEILHEVPPPLQRKLEPPTIDDVGSGP